MKHRVAYIDNLRILVNFLIVINHAFWNKSLDHLFSVSELGMVEWVRFLSMNLGPIRVPFFFLIAGVFSTIYLTKKGMREFFMTRWKRIVIPLVVALFTYSYIVVVISRFGDISFLWNPGEYVNYIRGGFYEFGYVWFLYVLVIYSCVILAVYWAALRINPLKRLLLSLSAALCGNRYWLLGVLLALEAFKLILLHVIPKSSYPEFAFFPFEHLVRNLTYFGAGALAGIQFQLFHEKIRFSLPETGILILCYAVIGWLGLVWKIIPYGFFMYSLISGALPLVLLLSVFNVFIDKRYNHLNFVTNSTYTIYLIHFPLICVLSYCLVKTGVPPISAYIIVIFLAYPVSLGAALAIRRIRPVAFLFGAKPLYRFRRSTQ